MYKYLKIVDIRGREVLDSRGNPTVEAQVTVKADGKAGSFYCNSRRAFRSVNRKV